MNRWYFVFFVFLCTVSARGQTTKSPNVYVQFLNAEIGGHTITGPEDDVFFGKLFPREAATMTGVPRGDKTIAESRTFARKFFREAVLDFSAEESAALKAVVARLVDQFGDSYPLLVRRPWKFIKTRADLCGSFSFTRGDCIVLSERTLVRIVKAQTNAVAMKRAEELLLHEQIHVLQRAEPNLFSKLYEEVCGFRAAKVNVSPWVDQRQVTNPDGTDDDWVFDVKSIDGELTTYWVGTILEANKLLHQMGRDFNTVAVALEPSDAGYRIPESETGQPPVYDSLAEMTEITSELPLPPGYDHVNEVGAYLFTSITHNNPKQPTTLTPSAARVLEESRIWFSNNLKQKPESNDHEDKSGT